MRSDHIPAVIGDEGRIATSGDAANRATFTTSPSSRGGWNRVSVGARCSTVDLPSEADAFISIEERSEAEGAHARDNERSAQPWLRNWVNDIPRRPSRAAEGILDDAPMSLAGVRQRFESGNKSNWAELHCIFPLLTRKFDSSCASYTREA
jgi:methylthioribose-1-phosphate isomerase